MEGPLSKWTNVMQGWQYRWFVLDLAMGVLSYYTSKEKMVRGDRRGCVKLKNAQVGINDEDDSTFTITVDSKIFHFQARDADERQNWLDALQEARDLHTENYALLQHTSRLLDPATSMSEFDRRIIEADAYLQILIDQHQELDLQLNHIESFPHDSCEAIKLRLQHLIELVKKTIVCLQFAKDNSGIPMVNLLDRPFEEDGLAYQHSLIATARDHQPIFTDQQDTATLKYAKQKPRNRMSAPPVPLTTRTISLDRMANTADSPITSDRTRPTVNTVPEVSYSSSEEENEEFFDTREHPHSITSSSFSGASEDFRDCYSYTFSTNSNSLATELARHIPVDHPSHQLENSGITFHPDINNVSIHTGVFGPGVGQIHQTPLKYANVFAYDPLYDDDDEKDLESIQSQGSVISYLLSQLRIGMDLTRITLPTFILEKRSTLEMYADFLAHPDLWVAIVDGVGPRERMVACLRWYLSAFHASRKSSVCKKPYNPILGEVFRCCWPMKQSESDPILIDSDIPVTYPVEELASKGPMPYAADDCVVFLAEQVSHHPPISAFYAEYVPKNIQVAGNIWTKSKFLGLSIGVEMVGSATVSVIDLDEEYTVLFPSAYGRNILSVPWLELGGRTTLTCMKTGYSASVDFRTKPFYGGKKDQIRAEVLAPGEKKPFLVVEGEWNGQMFTKDADGNSELFVDTKQMSIMAKQVRPRNRQESNESRKMWENVTHNLKINNIDAATDAKTRLEQRQRKEAAARQETKTNWNAHYFTENGGNYPYKWPLISRLFPHSSTPWSSMEEVRTIPSNPSVPSINSTDGVQKIIEVDLSSP